MDRQLSTGSRGGTGGEDSKVRTFLKPPVPCTSVETGGPQSPHSPPNPSSMPKVGRWGLSARAEASQATDSQMFN